MSKTITLPDHISFEEIALEWCRDRGDSYLNDERAVTYACMGKIFYKFVYYTTHDDGFFQNLIAAWFPVERVMVIFCKKEFQPILDYIKERSNGQN